MDQGILFFCFILLLIQITFLILQIQLQNGEPSLPIVGHTPYETMHEWVDVWLNKMAEDPTFSFNGAKMDGKHRFSSCYTDDIRNEDLKSMDETRKQMLSQIMTSVSREEELPFIEGKAKKIQKGFQVYFFMVYIIIIRLF
jgi:hypothetical protein